MEAVPERRQWSAALVVGIFLSLDLCFAKASSGSMAKGRSPPQSVRGHRRLSGARRLRRLLQPSFAVLPPADHTSTSKLAPFEIEARAKMQSSETVFHSCNLSL